MESKYLYDDYDSLIEKLQTAFSSDPAIKIERAGRRDKYNQVTDIVRIQLFDKYTVIEHSNYSQLLLAFQQLANSDDKGVAISKLGFGSVTSSQVIDIEFNIFNQSYREIIDETLDILARWLPDFTKSGLQSNVLVEENNTSTPFSNVEYLGKEYYNFAANLPQPIDKDVYSRRVKAQAQVSFIKALDALLEDVRVSSFDAKECSGLFYASLDNVVSFVRGKDFSDFKQTIKSEANAVSEKAVNDTEKFYVKALQNIIVMHEHNLSLLDKFITQQLSELESKISSLPVRRSSHKTEEKKIESPPESKADKAGPNGQVQQQSHQPKFKRSDIKLAEVVKEDTWDSYLPGVLPSIKEAEEESYGSDHAPVFTTIQTKHFGDLKFLSFNAYVRGQTGMDLPYAPQNTKPKRRSEEKSDEMVNSIGVMVAEQHTKPKPRSKEKSDEMVNSIGVMVAEQQPDFVLLQEVISEIPKDKKKQEEPQKLTLQIAETLEKNKVVFTNKVDQEAHVRIGKYSNVMFHSDRMDKGWNMDDVNHTDISLKNDLLNSQINLFKDSEGNMLCIWNVHVEFSAFPDETEEHLHDSLEKFDGYCERNKIDPTRVEHIFGGDFNGNFAHVSGLCPVNCTNVATSMGDGRQTYKSPDGFFYATKNAQGNYEFTQPDVQIIDPKTGKAITERPKLSNFKSKAQRAVILAQHPVLALDKSNYGYKFIDNKTIFEYESYLREQLKCDQIIVRPTSDYHGCRGISIGFKQINQHDIDDTEQNDKNCRAKEIFDLAYRIIKDENRVNSPHIYLKTNMAGDTVTHGLLVLSTMNVESETLSYLNEAMSKVITTQSLIDNLNTYIKRIESYKLESDQTKIDYAHGFWFFPETRAAHRCENYKLAKNLRDELKAGNDVPEVFSKIEKTGSTELNAIIETAQKDIEIIQKTLKPS